ncbi:MAG: OsmC family peroxiredoxin [Nevskia sp.]|nr:OsmC family peroxiredoxin [Nevskia sp.]
MSTTIKVRKAAAGKLKQQIEAGKNVYYADADEKSGGDDAGPDPHALLDSAFGACTALTVTMVARHKQMPLTDVRVEITHQEADGVYHLQRKIELVGDLTAEQRTYLLGIANKCPIHRALSGRFEIATTLQDATK